jgi:hypothetical protein
MGPINAKSLAGGYLASGGEIVTPQLPVEPAAPCHWPLRKRAAVKRPKSREETPKEGVLNKYKKIIPKKHEMPPLNCVHKYSLGRDV